MSKSEKGIPVEKLTEQIEQAIQEMRDELDKRDFGDPEVNAEFRAVMEEKLNDALAKYYVYIDQLKRR